MREKGGNYPQTQRLIGGKGGKGGGGEEREVGGGREKKTTAWCNHYILKGFGFW